MNTTTHFHLKRPSVAEVSTKDRFWTPYLENIRLKTLPYVLDKFEEIGYADNFRIVAGLKEGEHKGPSFSDGLLLETVRGASDLLASRYDADLDARLDALIAIIAAASDADPDGFVCTKTLLQHPHQRWGENGGDIIVAHDLYDHGALIEADRGLVAVMRGPWLLCAEEIDNPDGVDFTLAEDAALCADGDGARGRRADGGEFRLIPYYRWCNRENAGRMQVWFRQENMRNTKEPKEELYCDYE